MLQALSILCYVIVQLFEIMANIAFIRKDEYFK